MVSRPAGRAWSTVTFAALLVASSLASRAQQPDSARRESLPAILIGRVIDSLGSALAGAEITLFKSESIRTVTGDSGDFRLTGLPAGTNVFNVRRLGYQPASFTAALKSGKTHRATFTLSVSVQPLPVISVSDTAGTHWLDQFERRRSTSRGTFITRADIVKRTARTGSDIVRTVPGVRVIPGRMSGTSQVTMTRGAGGGRTCFPTMYVHNMPYSGVLDDFSADDIEALEIYVGISEIPPELDKNGRGICGVIVVWTRDPKKPGSPTLDPKP